ncbi:methyl-accepting chemotaxis protein [Amphibacillus marinus]|uniref:methyl-accepting chemotaxis protein n=1 Tax=Amphibacillus marinus TaxID=872970 RepID=UPI0015A52517|nr:methyl-accepting chemotaxis protein [Amphibacillus marinus]
MKKFKQIQFKSLRLKILLGFMVLVLLLFGYSGWNFYSSWKIQEETINITNSQLPLLIINEKLGNNIAERIGLARAYVLYGDETYIEAFNVLTSESQKIQDEATVDLDSEELGPLIELIGNWRNMVEQNVFYVYQLGNQDEAARYLQEVAEPVANKLMSDFKEQIDYREDLIIESGDSLLSQNEASNLVGLIVSVSLLISAIAIALIVAQMITKPIKAIRDRMTLIASGDLKQEPMVSKTKDELADLIQAMNSMQSSLADIVGEIQGVSNTVAMQSQQLTEASGQVKEAGDQISVTMEELSQGAETQATTTSEIANSMHEFNQQITEANGKGEVLYHSTQEMIKLATTGRNEMETSIKQMGKIYDVVSNSVSQVKGL